MFWSHLFLRLLGVKEVDPPRPEPKPKRLKAITGKPSPVKRRKKK